MGQGHGGAMHQQHWGAAVLHHLRKPLQRVGRIERHIGPPSLERGIESLDHCQTAFQQHADQHIRSNAQGLQVPRQAIGMGIEFGIRPPLAGGPHRLALRRQTNLTLEHLVDASLGVEGMHGAPLQGGQGHAARFSRLISPLLIRHGFPPTRHPDRCARTLDGAFGAA